MKRWAIALAMLAVGTFVGTSVAFEDKNPLEGVMCMMMPNKAIKADKAVDYKEGNVYFCCPGCVKKFGENTEKFAAKANHQLVATKQYKQEACPFSGGKLNADTAIEVGKVKVAFCCNNCKGKAEKMEGDAQVEAVFGKDAFEKGKFTKVVAEKK
jgi:YHS domain-containing protein